MATLLGRHKVPCLSCGFEHVHVKNNEGKLPYLHCPECGLTVPTRNGKQAAGVMAGLRPEKHTSAPQLQAGNPPQLERRADDINVSATPPAPAAAPAAAPVPAAPPKRAGWTTLLGT